MVNRRQKPGAPKGFPPIRVRPPREEDNETGQILIYSTQSIGDPGTKARSPQILAASMNEQLGGSMIELIRLHRVDHADLVQMLLELREQA